jgi:hypothetical protein
MPDTATASDLEKAHLILSEFGLLIGPAGEVSDVIARAVAAGIALGRKEALAAVRRNDGS